jgi:8-hydroxy-5-deazaflavin:NADPH oxidoreductase
MVINALNGRATIAAIKTCKTADFKGKTILDVSNPLDFSKGFPPSLIKGLNNTNSLGEAIQKTLPNAKVVKTLNTMWAGLMVNPTMLNGGNHINFVCGNDADAKAQVKTLLASFGWAEDKTLDLGDITNARGTEAMLPIWVRIYGAIQTGVFNFGIVK